jgi:pimeloyl-ACP methyl ester carboxylesterase
VAFVLVHGGGMDASSWDRLVDLLDGEVVAVDLPGRGSRSGADLTTVTIESCAAAVVDDILAGDLREVVLVGHSLAGVTLPRVVERVRDRIARAVYLSAVIPPQGTSVLDNIDPAIKPAVEASLTGGIYRQDPASIAPFLCNDLDEEGTAFTLDHIVDDAAGLLLEPVDLTGLGDVPRTYIRQAKDQTYPPELQQRAIANVAPVDVIELDTGHMGMVGKPKELAHILNELATRS